MTIADNVISVREKMAHAAIKRGIKPEDVMLVAATKTQNAAAVKQAIAAGVDACGENREQELTEKYGQGAYIGAPLHFIGHLQKNKVKKIVGTADIIQSVDSAPLLKQISDCAVGKDIVQEILIQVNIGNDLAKFGISADEIYKFLEFAEEQRGIKVRGLMTILPINQDSDINRRFFSSIYNLFVDIRGKRYDNVDMHFLSMGMSGDYYDAILAGANVVRVGSAIFGQRNIT